MMSHTTKLSARRRGAPFGLPCVAVAALLALPTYAFVGARAAAPLKQDGTQAAPAPLAVVSTYTVNSTGDAPDFIQGDGKCLTASGTGPAGCTLRAAIQEANAHAGDDAIAFAIPSGDANCDSSGRCTINLNSQLPNLSTNIDINGPGADKLTVQRGPTAPAMNVFTVTTGTVNLSGLTVSRGGPNIYNSLGTVGIADCKLTDGGGGQYSAVYNHATMSVVGSTLSNNFGGQAAVYNEGTLSIVGSTLSDNHDDPPFSATSTGLLSRGGGVYNAGTLTVSGCTLSGNLSNGGGGIGGTGDGLGGGLYNEGTATVTNCTLSGNYARTYGGGVYNRGTLNISNSTVSGNSTTYGGGIYNFAGSSSGIFPPGSLGIKSTLVALNSTSDVGGGPDVNGPFTSGGFNLVGKRDTSTGFSQGTDQTGSLAAPLDPKLDPAGLKNNGGPTPTVALLTGSPAIDRGRGGTDAVTTQPLTTDQRGSGFPRTFDDPAVSNAAGGDGTDVGAFELQTAATTPTPTPTPTSTPTPTPSPTPTSTAVFQFDSDTYGVLEGCTFVNVRVLRAGAVNNAAAVDVSSSDGTARQKGDYTIVLAHLDFAPNETQKTIPVLVSADGYNEGAETATLSLQSPSGGVLGSPATATVTIFNNTSGTSNPMDDSRTFVGQHYHDFLYRQSDQSGEDFWTQNIESCGASAQCRQVARVNTSAAFFLSIEFKETGYLVVRAHKAAFGSQKTTPRYAAFLRDQHQLDDGLVVGQTGWEQKLEANKQSYLANFVSLPEFVAQFPQGMAAAAYVDKLFQNAGAASTAAERNAALAAYGMGDAAGRAAALRSVIESGSVFNADYNAAFVLMQYFGYLRRNPDDAPDADFTGYDFWLSKLNSVSLPGEDMRDDRQAQARAQRAEMVRAFVESIEYRQRFGGSPQGNQAGAADSQ